MQDSKLVKIFRTMSGEEFKFLRKFTQSNCFNTDPNLILLLDALGKYFPDFTGRGMKQETLYRKVFGEQAYNDAKWRNLVFKMNKLTEEYLVWTELKKTETTRQKLLAAAYGQRNLYFRFEKNMNELTDQLTTQSQFSPDALRERVQAHLQFYYHPLTPKVENINKLHLAMDDLDHYYFAEKLRLACDLKVAENMVVGASPIRLLNEVIRFVQQENQRDLDYLKIYEKVYALLASPPSMEAFQAAFDFFIGIEEQLSNADRQFGLLHLLNFAIHQANKGEIEFRPKVLLLYKLGLERGALFTNGNISDNTFANIVSTASGLGDFDWTKQFILSYESYLPSDARLETTTLSYGYLYFHQNDYVKAIDILYNYAFQDFNKLLASKNLLLRCYFELFLKDSSYYSVFTSFAKAQHKFVNREKQISLTRKAWYKNLISILLNIAKHKFEYTWNKAVKAKTIEEISSKPMYLKAWITSRIKAL